MAKATQFSKPRIGLLKRMLILAAILLPLAAAIGFGGYYYRKYNQLKNNPVTAEEAARVEEGRTLAAVRELYDVPKDEKPQIATVLDKDELKRNTSNQPFFDNAENGDQLLVYQKAKLAILYRPSTGKLVKVGPLQVQKNPVIKLSSRPEDRVAVEQTLKEAKLEYSIGEEPKAAHAGVLIIDLKGQHAEAAQNLASLLGGQITTLPEGETAPAEADILVIIAPVPVVEEPPVE